MNLSQKKRGLIREEKNRLTETLDFNECLGHMHNINSLGQFAVEYIADILKAKRCSLMLFDRQEDRLFILAAKGIDQSIIPTVRKKIGEKIAGLVAERRQPMVVEDIQSDEIFRRFNQPQYRTHSFMSVPIVYKSKLIGVINVSDKFDKSWEAFDDNDLRLLYLLTRAIAVEIENIMLYQYLDAI